MCFQFQQMYSCETVGKGVCIAKMGAVRNYSTNTIMKKKKKNKQGWGVKDMEFSGVFEK